MQEVPPEQPLLPLAVAKVIGQAVPGFLQGRTYSFLSEDERWKIALTREFLALSTATYISWSEFRSKLQVATDALVATYSPSFFVRIGLRYRDVIRKATLGLEEIQWSKLLKPHVLGELGHPRISKLVQHSAHDLLISLDGRKGQVRILHGLIREGQNRDFSYSIDSDFFYEGRTELTHVFEYLDSFNKEAGKLFRWSITPLLHKRLGPTKSR